MVEKFNFYDVYGYLFPGIALCGLIWVPFGLLFHSWPTQEISSAVFLLVLSYFIGHLIQSFAVILFPSSRVDETGRERYPSDLILDENRGPLTKETKRKIEELSQKYLDISLATDFEALMGAFSEEVLMKAFPKECGELKKASQELEENRGNETELKAEIEKIGKKIRDASGTKISGNRNDAFFQARSALLRDKKSVYWEQFEGLYALMRGLSAALVVASAYFFGWAGGYWHKVGAAPSLVPRDKWSVWAGVIITILLLALVQAEKRKAGKNKTGNAQHGLGPTALRLKFLLLGVALLGGFLLAVGAPDPPAEDKEPHVSSLIAVVTYQSASKKDSGGSSFVPRIAAPGLVMVLLGLAAAITSMRCFRAYQSFAWSFAEHVWRDFANLEGKWSSGKSGDNTSSKEE